MIKVEKKIIFTMKGIECVKHTNNRDAANLIQRTEERIDRSLSDEHGANKAYSAFKDLINSEINAKLKCFFH